MTTESFKAIYRYKTLPEKINLLCNQIEIKGTNDVYITDAQNKAEKAFYYNENKHIRERIEWLYNDIMREVKNNRRMIANI